MYRVGPLQGAEWTGFLAAQLFNAGAAAVAHVPAWLPGVNIPRETIWLRRLLILESIAPVPGSAAALVRLGLATLTVFLHRHVFCTGMGLCPSQPFQAFCLPMVFPSCTCEGCYGCVQAAYVKLLWSLQQDACYLQAFQQESDNARAHLTALLSARPSTMQKLLVLLSQASSMHVTPGNTCCGFNPLLTAKPQRYAAGPVLK